MKRIMLSALFALPFFSFASERDKPIDQRDPTLPVRAASTDDWLKSWQPGYKVQSMASFKLEGDIRILDDGNPKFWWNWKKYTNQRLHSNYEGKSIVNTYCLTDAPTLKLVRIYNTVLVDRTLATTLEPTWTPFKTIIQVFSEGKGIGPYIERVQKFLENLPVVGKDAKDFANPFLQQAESLAKIPSVLINMAAASAGIQLKNGGAEIATNSPFWKNLPGSSAIDQYDNMAMTLRDALHAHSFYIGSNGRWDSVFISLSEDNGYRFAQLSEMQEKAKNSNESFDTLLNTWTANTPHLADKSPVRGLFERETFALTRAIFGGMKRNIGESWTVDGGLFNSFLHPDLQGSFTGKAILTYKETDTIASKTAPQKKYNCRIIELRDSAEINGRKEQSSLKYDEGPGKFNAALDTRVSTARLFIDNESGQVIRFETYLRSKLEVLPELLLTEGLKGDGELRFEVRYDADVVKSTFVK